MIKRFLQRFLNAFRLFFRRPQPATGPDTESVTSSSASAGTARDVQAPEAPATPGEDTSVPPPPDPLALTAGTSLPQRVLALTSSFETGRGFPDCYATIAGDFDNQGLSFGALQWNLGQGTLQELWKKMHQRHEVVLMNCLDGLYDAFVDILFASRERQLAWSRTIQYSPPGKPGSHLVTEEWATALRSLALTEEMMLLQVEQSRVYYDAALVACKRFGLTRERGVALMFDIAVQNGNVDRSGSGPRMLADMAALPSSLTEEEREVERMRIVARRRAEVASPQWRDDVLSRKMTIANGYGVVHGKRYEIEKEYAIGMRRVE